MKAGSYLVLNRSKNVCLAHSAESAFRVLSRVKGLIGRSEDSFPAGCALWIMPSDGIHTIGMRFPIDAAYLDADGRVVRTYHSLVPHRIAAIMRKARSVLELPPGTLCRTGTEIGDRLEFLPNIGAGKAIDVISECEGQTQGGDISL